MPDTSKPMSRRGLFRALIQPFSQHLEAVKSSTQEGGSDDVADVVDPDAPQIAVIQGRFCLAYQGGMCFTCSEQCPEPGAITTQQGIPTVHLDVCTGCGICHDLCPAPRNAILMIERKPEHGKAP